MSRSDEMLACVEGDMEIFRDIVRLFLDVLPETVASLHEAITSNDHAALASRAHAIKGSTGVFGSSAALDTALRLEALAREGNVSNAVRECAQLEADLDRLADVLRQVAGI